MASASVSYIPPPLQPPPPSGLMQDDRRSMSAPTAGPYGTQSNKIAIPRLTSRRVPPPPTAKSRQRDRVQRACRNCHKRSGPLTLPLNLSPSDLTNPEIKCSGSLPRCNYCDKTDKPCVYERPRKDRLALSVSHARCTRIYTSD